MTITLECAPSPPVLLTTEARTRELLDEVVRLIDAGGVRIDTCALTLRHDTFTLHIEGGRVE